MFRLVDGDAKPTMGYIYEAMDKAKEQIQKNFPRVKKIINLFGILLIEDEICNCISPYMQLHIILIQSKHFI